MTVRSKPSYRRRRIIASLLAVAFLVVASFAVSRAVGVVFGERADATQATPATTAAKPVAKPVAKPAPKPQPGDPSLVGPVRKPVAAQGGPGPTAETAMVQVLRLTGDMAPKSVVASGHGQVFAQNMMYRHTVSAFRADGALIATIKDSVALADHGIPDHPGQVKGAPVEVAFTPDGSQAWVSNYSMYGKGFGPEGKDSCTPGDNTDESYVYRISTATHAIEKVVRVGAVPKYVAITPDAKKILVTNWCTWDLSIIDAATATEEYRVKLGGQYPRGIAISPDSTTAYVALMGSDRVVAVNLATRAVRTLATPGDSPRHLVISPDGRYLYATNNRGGSVVKLSRETGAIVDSARTGSSPRSMAISPDGAAIYVVNYDSSTVSKVRTSDMEVIDEDATDGHPIGITYEPTTKAVWVACYGGSILVFDDSRRPVA